jgi:hypothetical protein
MMTMVLPPVGRAVQLAVIDAALSDALVLRGQYRTCQRRYCESSVNVLGFKAKVGGGRCRTVGACPSGRPQLVQEPE